LVGCWTTTESILSVDLRACLPKDAGGWDRWRDEGRLEGRARGWLKGHRMDRLRANGLTAKTASGRGFTERARGTAARQGNQGWVSARSHIQVQLYPCTS
jgi:hypothetical protein